MVVQPTQHVDPHDRRSRRETHTDDPTQTRQSTHIQCSHPSERGSAGAVRGSVGARGSSALRRCASKATRHAAAAGARSTARVSAPAATRCAAPSTRTRASAVDRSSRRRRTARRTAAVDPSAAGNQGCCEGRGAHTRRLGQRASLTCARVHHTQPQESADRAGSIPAAAYARLLSSSHRSSPLPIEKVAERAARCSFSHVE